MRIGLVADIHDAVAPLTRALTLLREYRVDQIVTLGDAFDSLRNDEPAAEVAKLLHDANAIGVWGNHDVGLSHDVTDEVRDNADGLLLAFAARLQPQLVYAGCRFSHMEPWRDLRSLSDLWSFEGVPDTVEKIRRCLDAVPERILFMGHFHTWLVHHQNGPLDWDLRRPFALKAPDRFVVLVSSVAEGWCGIFDTDNSELTAIRCSV